MNFEKFIEETCRKKIDSEEMTHAAIMTGFLGEFEPRFSLDLGSNSQSRFDLSSLTKALVTTPLVYKDLHENSLSTQRSLGDWLGLELDCFSKDVLSLDLAKVLSHCSGLPDWLSLWTQCLDGRNDLNSRTCIQKRLKDCLDGNRDCQYNYSDVGFIILGFMLEEKYGQTLNELFSNLIREDLNLPNCKLSFNSSLDDFEASISTGYSQVRERELLGLVHDENAGFLGGVAGHAGAFGSSFDLWSFLGAMMRRPWGKRLLDENANQRVKGTQMIGLRGWHQGCGESSRSFASGNGMGHLGFTGTAFWYEPETNRISILLTNRVISQRISPWITNFRSEIFGALNEITKQKN